MNQRYYLAGPMRGYPKYNFEAFESASQWLEAKGYTIISPHRMDLALGFDPNKGIPFKNFCVKSCIRRDIDAILSSDGIIMLHGWEQSVGARAEKAIADWMDLPTFIYPSLEPYVGN